MRTLCAAVMGTFVWMSVPVHMFKKPALDSAGKAHRGYTEQQGSALRPRLQVIWLFLQYAGDLLQIHLKASDKYIWEM